jgi:hypothetical protein
MKKVIWSIIIVIVLLLLAVWSPWNNLSFSWKELLGLERTDISAGLIVYSLGGNMTIYIDQEPMGEVNLANSPVTIDGIEPGEHTVELVRDGSDSESYEKFIKKINFEDSISAILGYELGPTGDFSTGYVFYALSKNSLSEDALLSINSDPDGAKVFVNGVLEGHSPLQDVNAQLTQKQTIKIESLGYETLEFDIFPENQADRDKLKGYNLVIEANLFKIPIDITEESSE